MRRDGACRRIAETFARLRRTAGPGWSPTRPPAIPDLRALGARFCRRSIAPAPTCSKSACRSPIRWPTARSSSGPPSGRWPPAAACARRWRWSTRCAPTVAAPIVIFSYANPMLRMGARRVRRRAAAGAGVDGVLALDLPIEEAGEFREALAAAGIDTIFLLEPDDDRRADSEGGGARARVPVRHLAARRDRRARSGRVGRRGAGAADSRADRRCRSRWGSASRGRSTSPRSARTPTRRWSGARWSSLIAEASGSPRARSNGSRRYVRELKGACVAQRADDRCHDARRL